MQRGASRPRVLVADGDAKSLSILDASLTKAGYEVVAARSQADALRSLGESLPDIIVTEAELPDGTGLALCQEARTRRGLAALPVVLLAAEGAFEAGAEAISGGVLLSKPVYSRDVVAQVGQLLEPPVVSGTEPTSATGTLRETSLAELIQTVELSQQSAVIHLRRSGGGAGRIHMRDGRIVDVEVGKVAAQAALDRLFTWTEGTFDVVWQRVSRPDVVDRPTPSLLMAGLRRADAWKEATQTLPLPLKRLEMVISRVAERSNDLPFEVRELLRLFDGHRTWPEVVEASRLDDVEAATAVALALSDGLVREAEPAGPVDRSRLLRWLNRDELAPPRDTRPRSAPLVAAERALALSLGETPTPVERFSVAAVRSTRPPGRRASAAGEAHGLETPRTESGEIIEPEGAAAPASPDRRPGVTATPVAEPGREQSSGATSPGRARPVAWAETWEPPAPGPASPDRLVRHPTPTWAGEAHDAAVIRPRSFLKVTVLTMMGFVLGTSVGTAVCVKRIGSQGPLAARPAPPVSNAAGRLATVPSATVADSGPVNSKIGAAGDSCRHAHSHERYARILQVCGQALAEAPDDAGAMAIIAHAELDHGNYPASRAWAQRALAADPTLADAYAYLGFVDAQQGRTADALRSYRRYLDLAPGGKYAADIRAIVTRP